MHRIIFQHIPKTGGSTLNTVLLSNFDRDIIFKCGEDGVLADFQNLSQDERDSFVAVTGHVFYGLHDFFSGPAVYTAFFREPVSRVISHFFFIRNNVKHRYHTEANKLSLEEFVRSGLRPKMNNCVCRMISGIDAPYHSCSPAMLSQALQNIRKHYIFIGFVEYFAESVKRLKKILALEETRYDVRNRTKDKPSTSGLSYSTLGLIREYNALDIELYNQILSEPHGWDI